MPLYCTKAPGHWKYLNPIRMRGIVVLNTSAAHAESGGTRREVGIWRLSTTMPNMTVLYSEPAYVEAERIILLNMTIVTTLIDEK